MAGPRPRENVWEYPRPPRVEHVRWPVRVEHLGTLVADAPDVHRVLETTHPPVYYIDRCHILPGRLRPAHHRGTWCEWKGRAVYHDLVVAGTVVESAAWSYPNPSRGFEMIADAVAFYPSRVDSCTVYGEKVQAQEGDFYGGWITSWVDGGERGFKGGKGTRGW